MKLLAERPRPAGALPGGLRQRLALATRSSTQPPIVFLDEPTAGVDPEARREFWRIIRRLAAAGHDGLRDDALHGRGRVLRARRPHGRRKARRPRHARRRSSARSCRAAPSRCAGEGLVRALPTIRATAGIVEAQSFGNGVHVRFDPAQTSDDAVLAAVRSLSSVRVKSTEPVLATLEDVFLAAADKKAEDAVRGGP
jgi:ABC-2 type transport system ATP-binding protein